VRIALCLVLLVACGASQRPALLTTGAIAGLARDLASGDPVARAEIQVRGSGPTASWRTTTSDGGLYNIDHLPPGAYELTATFAGQPIDVTNIVVAAGELTLVDLGFTLGEPSPRRIDHGAAARTAIDRYRPRGLSERAAIIEGTVSDIASRRRVVGAVVTAIPERRQAEALQTVSDDHGRYRFDAISPGIYAVSAYYSISGRGQIEVRRAGIAVDGAEAVVVPLWIEMDR
jgi:hypothetical protein